MESHARFLVFHSGDGAGRPLALPCGVLSLGRDPSNQAVLSGNGVSRMHARVLQTQAGWVLEDLRSANGTWVNGARVERCLLRHGDEVQLGDVRLVFEDPTAAVPPPIPVAVPPMPPALPLPPPPLPSPVPAQEWPNPIPPSQAWAPPPPAPSNRSRTGLWVSLGAAGALLLVGAIWAVGRAIRPGERETTPLAASGTSTTGPETPGTPTPSVPLPPGTLAKVDAAAGAVETRLRAGDLPGLLELSHSTSRNHFRLAFEGHPERMIRAADLLATRKPVMEQRGLAEYEVREQGRTFTVIFEQVGSTWTLRSL